MKGLSRQHGVTLAKQAQTGPRGLAGFNVELAPTGKWLNLLAAHYKIFAFIKLRFPQL